MCRQIELVMDPYSCHHQTCVLRGHWDIPGCVWETYGTRDPAQGFCMQSLHPSPLIISSAPKALLFVAAFKPQSRMHKTLGSAKTPCRGVGQWNPSPQTCLLDPCLMNLSWSESSHWVTWGCPSLSWLQWKTFTRGEEGLPPAEAGSEPSGSPKAP